MSRRRRKARNLNGAVCKPVENALDTRCVTQGKVTFCVGDRVTRKDVKVGWKGSVVGFSKDKYVKGSTMMNVCQDDADPGDRAYGYHFKELKKA